MNLHNRFWIPWMRVASTTMGGLLAVLTASVAGLGWTYELSRLGWLDLGPRAGDALPLLQLAGFDAQPAIRLLVAWMVAGAIAGVALARVTPMKRGVLALAFGTAVLALSSNASYALARNLRVSSVLTSRVPGTAVWVEGLLFATGCALTGLRIARRDDPNGQQLSTETRITPQAPDS